MHGIRLEQNPPNTITTTASTAHSPLAERGAAASRHTTIQYTKGRGGAQHLTHTAWTQLKQNGTRYLRARPAQHTAD